MEHFDGKGRGRRGLGGWVRSDWDREAREWGSERTRRRAVCCAAMATNLTVLAYKESCKQIGDFFCR